MKRRISPLVRWIPVFAFACLVCFALWSARGRAATNIVVNSAANNVANDGRCTLREAITAANNNAASGAAAGECAAGSSGTDTISFNITDAGCAAAGSVCTIAPTSALPGITGPVTIDGYTQPGASPNTLAVGNNAVLKIELSGLSAPNGTHGLSITAGSTTVRGLAINRFGSAIGILLNGAGATGNSITGNFIGTNATGTAALANDTGIFITNGATNNRVGTNGDGTNDLAERNIVSGNISFGIYIQNAGTSGNIIAGNYVGTNAAGTAALANTYGIAILNSAANNRVGTNGDGTNDPAERNIVSGNISYGIIVQNAGTSGNIIAGNYIGTNAAGTAALANDTGIAIAGGPTNNRVGGIAAGEANTIAFNANDGVKLFPDAGTGNVVLSNSIHSNGTLGIELGADALTDNDAGDGDTGPNNFQNFPDMSSATRSGVTTTVTGTLDSTAGATFRVEFFSNASCDTSGHGEGRTYLGALTNVHPNVGFTFNTTTPALGEFITATATNATTNDTSEFSACRVVAPNTAPTASASSNPATTNEGTAVQITLTGTDADDHNLTFSITQQPTNGTLGTLSAPDCSAVSTCTATVTYTPNANFNGADFLRFRVNDGTDNSAEATVNIAVNDAPTASTSPNPAITNEDTSVQITLTGTDANDDNLTFSITQQPTNGTLGTLSAPNCSAVNTCTATVTYTPNANFNGADSFKFRDNDGTANSAEVTVNINVINADDDTTYVVNSTSDPGTGGCDATECTLREAIMAANADPGAETISFNITGAGCVGDLCRINLPTGLPTITGPVTIDGYTQPGASPNTLAVGNNAVLKIELSGEFQNAIALRITALNTTVRGLAINRFFGGIFLAGAGATGNSITGNFIGTNAADQQSMQNRFGIIITGGATNNRVGTDGNGTNDPAERNLVRSSDLTGIVIEGAGTSGNIIAGNYIGTNAAGTVARGNFTGIVIQSGATNNRVGGIAAGEANTIAFSVTTGIQISHDAGTGNAILSNSIHSNGYLTNNFPGIELGEFGVNANDAGDGDTGPNNRQNFPVLTGAGQRGAITTITGSLNSNANSTFRIEFFSNASCDTSGNGEGRTFLGSQNVTTDGSGNATINTTLAATITVGEFVTATATDMSLYDHDDNAGTANIPRNDTSEFSACLAVVIPNDAPTASANPATTNEDTAVGITLTGTDADDNNLTFSITQQPINGTLSAISAPDCSAVNTCTATVTYTPNANFNGAESFTYKASDGSLASNTASVTITVNAVNDNPDAAGDSPTIAEDSGANTFNVRANDSILPDANETLTVTAVTQGANGAVVIIGGGTNVSYTPNLNFNGTDSFTYTISDGKGGSDTATVNVTVTAVNDTPTITAALGLARQQGTAASNSTIATVGDTESGAGGVTVTVTSANPSNGVTLANIVNTNGTITANIVADCTATNASFTLQASDGSLMPTATLNVAVTANAAPTVGAYPTTLVAPGGNTTVTPNAAPADNGSIASVTATASPASFTGTLSGNTATGAITVTNAGPSGTYTVTVIVTDNCGARAQQTFTLTVNSLPTISATAATQQQGSTASTSTIASISDVDQSAGSLTVAVNGGASATVNGLTMSNLTNTNGTITASIQATCAATNAGFTLNVSDSLGATATATLNVSVTANTTPTLIYSNQTVGAAGSLTVNPATGLSDNGSIASVAVLIVTPAMMGAPTVASDGKVTIINAGPAGSHTITIRVTDNCGATTDASFTLNVTCPTITVGPDTIPGGTVGLPYLPTSFSSTGGNGGVTFSLSGTLPNGMSLVSGQLAGAPTQSGSFPITITATDAYGCGANRDYTLVIACPIIAISPAASGLPIAQINKSYSAQIFSASGGNAPYTISLSGDLPAGMSFSSDTLAGLPTEPGDYPFTINLTDKYGCTASRNYTLRVNRPPLALSQNITVTADATCTTAADINNGSSDPDGDTLTITQTPAGPYAIGTRPVTLTVDDGRGGVSTSTATVTINAPKPVPTITGPVSGTISAVGMPITFSGTFTDLVGTTHTASWKFESAAPPAITVAGTLVEPTGTNPGTVSVTQSFTTPGVYLVTLTVTNQCGGSDTASTIGADQFSALVVVYDPNGGFVSGGGWINSPAGAYAPDPTLTGKANFGFVSKYQNGANVPTGNTEFQFKAGNLSFKSTNYEWLVVAGRRAQYKGSGTINGAGDYRFILTAIDGNQPGGDGKDRFRIKIWNKAGDGADGSGLVYDTQLNAPDNDEPTTLLGGGSIVIHTK